MLSEYVTEVREHLNDLQGQFFSEATLHRYINRSRRRVAAASGCLRLLPEGTKTVPWQEVYPVKAWDALLQQQLPGARSTLAIRSVSIAIGQGGWKPMWRRIPWTDFQARFRVFNRTFAGNLAEPGWYAQYGLGPNSLLYLAPIPVVATTMEVDISCIPQPLLTDKDPEPIPYPWTDAVSYWAGVLALFQQQRKEDAQVLVQLFNTDLPMCAAVVCPQMIQTPYGAMIRSA